MGELRELARGIHPAALTEGGLRAALEALAARSTVPVRLVAVPDATLRARGGGHRVLHGRRRR